MEIATYYSDFYAVNLQTLADKAGKVRVGTYGCYVRKLRIILGKLVHLSIIFRMLSSVSSVWREVNSMLPKRNFLTSMVSFSATFHRESSLLQQLLPHR